MSILNDSVFLLQPTGVKESKIYSTFPTNGDGDFTFSRNSLKNRIAQNRYVTEVQQNIPSLSYKEISGVSDNCPHDRDENEIKEQDLLSKRTHLKDLKEVNKVLKDFNNIHKEK